MQIKICEKCFLCHSIVVCQSCYKCTKCCLQSVCRGQTLELLENLAGSGRRPKGSSNPQRGLYPPLPDPTKTSKISDRHKLLCQSPEEQLPTGGITSAYRQKCSRDSKKPNISELFQQIVSSPKTIGGDLSWIWATWMSSSSRRNSRWRLRKPSGHHSNKGSGSPP